VTETSVGSNETKGNRLRITPRNKLVFGAIALASAFAVAGSAFTGTGVTNNAGSTQFVGGTVSQSVTGATLSTVTYSFGDAPANTAVHSVALTFANADSDGKTPTIGFTGGNAVAFSCTEIAETTHLSTCTTVLADRVGVTSLAVTVS
jgi:hypothetical protein